MPTGSISDRFHRAAADKAGATSKRRGRMSLQKKSLFALLAAVGFFLVLELLLAAIGIQPALYDDDPYVGFTSQVPLFVRQSTADGTANLVTAQNKRKWFNHQQFPQVKPAGTFRVFCVGGSTTYGRPYDDTTSFCGWLRELLPELDSRQQWEVINAGGISYASYRVALLMEELNSYQPNLFIIYSGHNEFLERRTYADILETPAIVRGVGALFGRTRTYSVVKRLRDLAAKAPGNRPITSDLADEVVTVLDSSIGPDAYTRDDQLQRQVLAHYRSNLTRMVKIARSAGARVVLVAPAANLRNCSPFKSEQRSDLGSAELRRFRLLFEQATQDRLAGRFAQALTALDEAAAIDERLAELHYRRGGLLVDLQRFAEAKTAFRRALDEDICPLRAISPMQEIVAQVADDQNVPFVDFVTLVDKYSEHGIPGERLFLDHVHPTIDGNRLLAQSILDELVSQQIVPPSTAPLEEVLQRVTRRIESKLDDRSHAVALRNLSKVLAWAGKHEEADRLALRALQKMPDDANTQYLAGGALFRQGDLDGAEAHFRKSLRLAPESAGAHNALGLIFTQRGNLDQAAGCFQRALRINPNLDDAHYNLALVFEAQQNFDLAVQHLQHAIRINPNSLDAHISLGISFGRKGALDRAKAHFEQALGINPNHAGALYNLAFLFETKGLLDQAAEQYQRVLRVKPSYAAAHANLGVIDAQRGEFRKAIVHFREALQQTPAPVNAAVELAWILATNSDASLRDGKQAVYWADYAAKATHYSRPQFLDTLAAAYAEVGVFNKAVGWQEKAIELAPPGKKPDLAARLELYRSGKPFRSGPANSLRGR